MGIECLTLTKNWTEMIVLQRLIEAVQGEGVTLLERRQSLLRLTHVPSAHAKAASPYGLAGACAEPPEQFRSYALGRFFARERAVQPSLEPTQNFLAEPL